MDGFFELLFVWILVAILINPMKNATIQNLSSEKQLHLRVISSLNKTRVFRVIISKNYDVKML